VYKRSRGYIEAATINEKATIVTTAELSKNTSTYAPGMNKVLSSVDASGKASAEAFDNYADIKAKSLGLTGIIFKPSELENKARTIIPKITTLVTEKSYRGYSEVLTGLDPKVREKYPVKGRGMDTQELGRLCNGKNTALDIKKLLDTQLKQGETDLQDVINYIYVLKEAGLVTL
jgi:aminopeptidase YwaD